MNNDDNKQQDNQPVEEVDTLASLADALLDKGEDNKDDAKPGEENKGEEQAQPGAEDKKDADKPDAEEKPKEGEDKPEDGKPADGKPTEDGKPADSDKPEDKPTEEDNKPLTREDVRAAMREEQQAREQATAQRQSFSGMVRDNIKEDLKLDSTYTTVALDDGTPISSVDQLTQVINPATEEPYTREEAATLLLEARQIVDENIAAYDKRVDELTDLNVNFKEQADEVIARYDHIFKAFPKEAEEWAKAYQKTFTTDKDNQYVTNVPISPMDYYEPIVRPFLNAAAQVQQQESDQKAAEEKAAKDAEIKAEQEDRGDLSATAGNAPGKKDLLGDAIAEYGKNNY